MDSWTPRTLALALALSLALALWPAQAKAQGTLVSIGGALKDHNEAVWGRVVQAAGGPGARFVVVSAASSEPEAAAADTIALLRRYGAAAEHLAVGPRLNGAGLAVAVQDPRWTEQVGAASGVYFTGGDQSLIVQTLAPDGRRTPLLQALHELLRRGGVVAGSSAGAAAMSELMFTGGAPLAVLKGTAGVVHGKGLGFVQSGVLLDQHFLKRGRIGRLLPLLLQMQISQGLGVEEDSAVLIRGDEIEALGSRGVLWVDSRSASSDATLGAFNVRGVLLSYLEHGDRANLRTGQVTPAPAKLAARRVADSNPQWRPYFRGEHLFTEILGDFTIVNAMTRLVDSRLSDVRGLAFDPEPAAGDAHADLGFLWRLTRGADTAAWSVGDAYTVIKVQLDVQPVRMARPLFAPFTSPVTVPIQAPP